MQVTVRPSGEAPHAVPATLLGHNCEMCIGVGPGLSSDRLDNPRFMGPANPDTGIARGWVPGWNHNFLGTHYELTPGLYMSGTESQLIHNYSGRERGLLQIDRKIRAGETLEVTLWVRGQYHPVPLRVGLRPLDAGKPIYCEATVRVEKPYWHAVTATLQVPADDDAAVFFIILPEMGMVWIDQAHLRPAGMGDARTDVLAAFATLGIPVLRFPGGCISTSYHWQHGTGPRHLRPEEHDPVFKFTLHYEFGTDEYLQLCQDQGIMPQISVNVGTATVEEAAEWAAYVARWYRDRGIDPPAIYWQIGNEHYGAWEIGSMSGAQYVEVLHSFVPVIRANYPRARIIALGVEDGELMMSGQRAPWRSEILDHARDMVDVLAIQYYCGGWDTDPVKRQAAVMQSATGIKTTLQKAIDDIRDAGADLTVAMTEWNMWQYASHHDNRDFLEKYDVQHGLFCATVLNTYTELAPALELANFYNLFNVMGIFLAHGPEVVETPLVDVFRLYRPAFPAQATPLAIEGPVLEGTEIPAVTGAYLTNDDGGWLFLVNRSVTETAQAKLDELPQSGYADLLVGTELTGGWTKVSQCFEFNTVELPPMSIARVKVG
jgi:alpha-N-arabinofuranosidase